MYGKRYIKLEKEQKMKSKKVLTILLSLAIMLTFMPTMAFAAYGDDDNVTCTVTVEGSSQTITKNSIAEAIGAVNDGGSITVSGEVNNSIELDVNKSFTLDLTGATLASGVKVVEGNARCLVHEGNVYSYHEGHNYTSVAAVPESETASEETEYADVVFYCANGHDKREKHIGGTRYDFDDEYYIYKTDNLTTYGYNGIATWKVKKTATVKYTMAAVDVDYVKESESGLAVLDADGKVSFFGYYKANGNYVIGDDGQKEKATGTIKKRTVTQEADVDRYGESTYDVEFTFPDGTKTETPVKKTGVKDTPKTAPIKTGISAVEVLYSCEDGKDRWAAYTYPASGNAITVDLEKTIDSVPGKVVFGSDGELTFRLVYTTNKAGVTVKGDSKTLDVDKTKTATWGYQSYTVYYKYPCGAYRYAYKTYSERLTLADGSIETVTFTANNISNSEGKSGEALAALHTAETKDVWAARFDITKAAKHNETGTATASCQYCTASTGYGNVGNFPRFIDQTVTIPKTSNHSFLKDASGNDVVVTVAATCQHKGYQYKICDTSDNGWTAGRYPIYEKKDATTPIDYVSETDAKYKAAGGTTNMHPVLVEGSVTKLADHDYYVNGDPTWTSGLATLDDETEDVECEVNKTCANTGCTATGQFVYHKWTFAEAKTNAPDTYKDWKLDEGSEDTVTLTSGVVHVFGAIDTKIAKGADCTKHDTYTYVVKGITTVTSKAISTSVEKTYCCGPHTYKNTVTFSEDGKSASVLLQCTNKKCADIDGKAVKTQKAHVEATDNADGSTTYTATLEGVELKDNTKTVFDLSKATVTVNGGEAFDLNIYDLDNGASANTADKTKKNDFRNLVKVEINGVEIDSSIYTVQCVNVAGEGTALVAGNNNLVIAPVANKGAVSSAKAVAKCIKPKQFGDVGPKDVTLKDDGEEQPMIEEMYYSKYYDAKTVEFTIDKVHDKAGLDVKDATVQLAVSEKRVKDPSVLNYFMNNVELKDAGTFYVYAKISKDGYTTVTPLVATIYIAKPHVTVAIDNFTMKQGEQNPEFSMAITAAYYYRYFDDDDYEVSIDPSTIDKSEFVVTTAGGQKLSDLIPGDYMLLVSSKNYIVSTAFEEGRVGTVTVLTKDGKTADQDAKDAAAAADKALADAAKVKTGDYTPESVAAVQAAVDALNAAIKTGSIEDVKAATEALNKAVKNAVPIVANDMKVKVKKVKAKTSKKTSKKAVIVKKAEGKVTIKKANKAGGKKIVVKNNGKVIVKKGLKKGTYKVKVKVTAAGDATHKAKTVKKTVTVVVK
jgi:hypothetical protein